MRLFLSVLLAESSLASYFYSVVCLSIPYAFVWFRKSTWPEMSFVKFLAQKILESNVRKLEGPDIWRLYNLVHSYKRCGGQTTQYEASVSDQEATLTQQYSIVHENIQHQVQEVLDSIHNMSDQKSATHRFTLRPRPSSSGTADKIPGVLLKAGLVVPGAIVCFFPGTVYLSYQLKEMSGYPTVANNNPYLMARTDGSIIDAQKYDSSERNPLAVGHLIRHPPKGIVPNVMSFSLDIDLNFPQHLLSLVPNRHHRKPTWLFSSKQVVLRTIVFVATAHIKAGQELFLNYRLHPDSSVPDWYSPVEGSADSNRWS